MKKAFNHISFCFAYPMKRIYVDKWDPKMWHTNIIYYNSIAGNINNTARTTYLSMKRWKVLEFSYKFVWQYDINHGRKTTAPSLFNYHASIFCCTNSMLKLWNTYFIRCKKNLYVCPKILHPCNKNFKYVLHWNYFYVFFLH